jgi:hypothetical protein
MRGGLSGGGQEQAVAPPWGEFARAARRGTPAEDPRFIVPQFFSREHFPEMAGWSDDTFEDFREYLTSVITGGDDFVREGVQEVLDNFIREEQEDSEAGMPPPVFLMILDMMTESCAFRRARSRAAGRDRSGAGGRGRGRAGDGI